MQLNELLNEFSLRQRGNGAFFKNTKTGEILTSGAAIPESFMIECTSLRDKNRESLANIVPPEMFRATQSRSSGSSSNGIKAFNDADISEFNDWADSSTDSPVKKIVRKANDYLLFVLRHPVHWKRVYASLEHSSTPKLFDAIFDGPKGIKKEKESTMRSVGIRINVKSNGRLEDMSFTTYAFWDEDGNHGLRHPNVNADNNRICMGSLEGSVYLGKIRISDIITLMEGVNMTSAYQNSRVFYNNDGDEYCLRPQSDIYLRKEMFKAHEYLG